jgi:hypothetical protein
VSEGLLVGIIIAAATLLVPIVSWFLFWLSEKRAQLLVTVNWNSKNKNTALSERVKNLVLGSEDFKKTPRDEKRWEELELFRDYFSARSYLRFEILNNSKKKLTHLTLSDNQFSDLYQIGDGEIKTVDRSQPIVLGDLQPGRTMSFHLWCSNEVPEWDPQTKKRFNFS